MEEIPFQIIFVLIISCCGIGLVYGFMNWIAIKFIDPKVQIALDDPDKKQISEESITLMVETHEKIEKGASAFLWNEFLYLFVFLIFMGGITFCIDNFEFYTTIAFLLGAFTSFSCGCIGMSIATTSNVRVTYQAAVYKEKPMALKNAFHVAFRGGCVMGFCLVSLALGVLTLLIVFYLTKLSPNSTEDYTKLFEHIAGYGLGGSTVALFCRVGGGIYTKAADVGADLVGKNDLGLDEDSPKNPATIADNVGDNVGDIAGMGSDLFGSLAEASVAALVVSGRSDELTFSRAYFFPLIIVAVGIIVCIITSFFAITASLKEFEDIENELKFQLILSSILMTPVIAGLSMYILPKTIEFNRNDNFSYVSTTNIQLMVCVLSGLWTGLIIGYLTDYFTSNQHPPVQSLAQSCRFGASLNIIRGLALGYSSTLIPIIFIVCTIYGSFSFAGMYGIALSAIGMLCNLPICLAIDGYGPISDNAGGISEMSKLPKDVREITDSLDAAGNTTAAIGKGFAVGSACLVSLALFGAFITRTRLEEVDVLEPIILSSLIVGAMVPFLFSALTMTAVGDAAADMCKEVQRQIDNGEDPGEGYLKCIKISTEASLKEMILPGIVVLFTPICLGSLVGPKACSGYLSGVIVSGVQMAISSSNTGGAWDNAKKFIEAEKLLCTQEDRDAKNDKTINETSVFFPKRSKPHKAAVIGDTVGDPLKDTSGPSLNILVKLSAVTCLIFGKFFKEKALMQLR